MNARMALMSAGGMKKIHKQMKKGKVFLFSKQIMIVDGYLTS